MSEIVDRTFEPTGPEGRQFVANRQVVTQRDNPVTSSNPLFHRFLRDSYTSTAVPEVLDRSFHAALARWTSGLSPAVILEAYFDWALHLATSPGKQVQLSEKAVRKVLRLALYAAHCARQEGNTPPCIEPLPQDRRFRSDAWKAWPHNLIYQSFLLTQQWWSVATSDVRGVNAQHEKVVEFATRQLLDMVSPANFPWMNPEVLQRTASEAGGNLVRGSLHFWEDFERILGGKPVKGSEDFVVGRDVAATPGKVIYRNELMELIHYAPTTSEVNAEPVLIVPAWIMKYYILDLSPQNSLVRYLVGRGFNVFMISWRNPGPEHRDIGLSDYRKLGVNAALDAVGKTSPDQAIHLVGYCLGGTLASIAAAAMARDSDDRLKSLTLFAAQTDFTEPGELGLFINESQLAFLEDMMWEQGFLGSGQMGGAFQLLRSNDLVWSRMVREYLMGDRAAMNDLMAWNADGTRMPYRMHSEYLRWLFLDNDLATGRYLVDGRPIALSDIRVPIFAVGTQTDHVAPWRSVFKLHLLTDTEVTFLLTSGGHNAGIVSEPGHPRRHYQVSTQGPESQYLDPDSWTAQTPVKNGSWWPEWAEWLESNSHGKAAATAPGATTTLGHPLGDAPGIYIYET